MTLLEDICLVHDGVLKAPPLRAYGHSETYCIQKGYASELKEKHINDESVYKAANKLAIEAVRIMQLASKNIEKERQATIQEAEYYKPSDVREMFDNLSKCHVRKCHTDAFNEMLEEVKKNLKMDPTTIEKMTPPPANNHPIAVLRIEHDKPVFSHVSREMSGLDDADDAKKAKAALNRLEQQDEPDYVFEVGILLGTVRK